MWGGLTQASKNQGGWEGKGKGWEFHTDPREGATDMGDRGSKNFLRAQQQLAPRGADGPGSGGGRSDLPGQPPPPTCTLRYFPSEVISSL